MTTSKTIKNLPGNGEQSAVLSFFQSQLASPTDQISTHCAHIFLIGDYAFKIKKAISYSYLDMSTVEKRKQLCERELSLNSPALPDIYLNVVPITQGNSQKLSINGGGTAVEWALKMRRFDEDQVLDNIAIRGELSVKVAKDMGRTLAQYHDALPALHVNDGFLRIREVYDELLEEFNILSCVFSPAQLEHFTDRGERALENAHRFLDQRAEDGFIKRCHGDLHLRNILMTSAGPVPFDALEFDERLATTDVLYDLAFLIMDMIHRDMPEQANALLNSYLLHSVAKQCNGLRHLPLFLYARSAIRAMTTAQAVNHQSKDKQSSLEHARNYLTQANLYLQETKPRLLAIGGLSGVGKSSVSEKLAYQVARSPGAILLRSDAERKMLAGVSETDQLPDSEYTNDNSGIVYQHLFTKAKMALESGATVILDAVFHERELRTQAQELAQSANVPFTGLWLEAPVATMTERINQRRGDASDADVKVLHKQMLKATGFLDWTHIDASGSLDQTIKIAMTELDRISSRNNLNEY